MFNFDPGNGIFKKNTQNVLQRVCFAENYAFFCIPLVEKKNFAYTWKELSLCHKLGFSRPYIFLT